MITTKNGIVIRLPIKDVSVLGRNTQGVTLINVGEGDAVADVAQMAIEDDGANGAEDSGSGDSGAGEDTAPGDGDA
jgi:DNA gyrase subunit A